jgi:transcriptional regulator with XRE-family HTH domain
LRGRVFREHRSLSAALLAEKSGIAVSYVAAIESGSRRASAKALSAPLAAVSRFAPRTCAPEARGAVASSKDARALLGALS